MSEPRELRIGDLYAKVLRRLLRCVPERWARQLAARWLRFTCVDRDLRAATIDGAVCCASPRDYVSHDIFFFGDHDSELSGFVRAWLRPGDHAIDIGAERGWYTLLMAGIVGPLGAVAAFEPHPVRRQSLERSLHLSSLTEQVRCFAAALGAAPGRATFIPPESSEAQAVVTPACNGGLGFVREVADGDTVVESLDAVMATLGWSSVRLIKIDAEGAEVDIIRGGSHTIARYRPLLLIEFNTRALARRGHDSHHLLETLTACGYRAFLAGRRLTILDHVTIDRLDASRYSYDAICFHDGA